jgi:presenilin-like A22 family membrane protease
MLLYDSGSGILEGRIELAGISNGPKGVPTQVCLVEPSDTELKVYVLTPEGLWKISIDFSLDSYIIPGIISVVVAAAAVALLFFFPEWYVIDIVGIVMAIGTIAVIGISLSILPLFILLAALAAYDAIAVYKTKHMITMASSVIDMRLPVLLVIPKKMKYSFRSQKELKKQLKTGEERAAMFIGLGDIIIPGTLAVSAYTFLSPDPVLLGIGGNVLVAAFVLVGTLVGFGFLMRFVLTGKPQAGLPLLCTGAIYGYTLGYILFFQDPTFGFSLPTDLLDFLP